MIFMPLPFINSRERRLQKGTETAKSLQTFQVQGIDTYQKSKSYSYFRGKKKSLSKSIIINL